MEKTTVTMTEAVNPSEFTQHTMTEQEILAHPEFIQAKNVLEHRSLKPSEAIEISFPRDEWSVEAIATYLRCLAPYTKGCGYAVEVAADDKNEYLIFINRSLPWAVMEMHNTAAVGQA